MAAKVDKIDRSYYKTRIKPLLKDPLVEHIGEIGDSDKGAFLGDAMAALPDRLARTIRPCAHRSDGQRDAGDRFWTSVGA